MSAVSMHSTHISNKFLYVYLQTCYMYIYKPAVSKPNPTLRRDVTFYILDGGAPTKATACP